MRILQVSTADVAGGAERVAWNLFQEYRRAGHQSWLAVGRKRTADPDVLLVREAARPHLELSPHRVLTRALDPIAAHSASARRVQQMVARMFNLPRWLRWQLGLEELDFPETYRLLSLPPARPDILHCHNLHGQILPGGGYFDLRALPWLSRRVPLVLTLHDTWMLTGHCAYTLGCQRWRTGCGRCPDLSIYPAIRRDATAWNWKRKRAAYQGSRLYVAAPSRWLMEQIEQSVLAPSVVEGRVIPNGVDLSVFGVGNRSSARRALGLPDPALILLFAANGIRRNEFKDFPTVRAAFDRVAAMLAARPLLLIALGEDAPSEYAGTAEIRFVRYEHEAANVARFYQAADVYVHAARADTFPNVVLEALACGIPVVATAVGGIPEQIEDGQTGFLVPAGDPEALASRIFQVLTDDTLRSALGTRAAAEARARFGLRHQVQTYLDWYACLVDVRTRTAASSGV